VPIAGNFHGFHAWQESRNPRHDNAISQGIETIYQESALVAQLTISGSGASHSTALSRRAHRCARDDGAGASGRRCGWAATARSGSGRQRRLSLTGRVLRNTHADHWLGREIDLLQQIEAEAARYSAARERENLTSALAR
jgi:hypothetical protein